MESQPGTPQADDETIDFDGAWKEALDHYLEDALRLLAPAIAADIDWHSGITALDKELQRATSSRDRRAKTADKLVRVALRDGSSTWVLIHLEVQSQHDTDFAARMLRYNTRLFEKYGQEVNSLAILGDESPAWQPVTFSYGLWSKTQITFPVVKLIALDQATLEASANPFVMVVLAHRAAQQTRNHPQRRAAVKVELARRMLEKGFDAAHFDAFYVLVDWLLRLPEERELAVYEQVKALQEEYGMRHISTPERYGLEIGKAEGVREGIYAILEVRFGDIPQSVRDSMTAIQDVAELEALLQTSKTVPSLADFRLLLPQGDA